MSFAVLYENKEKIKPTDMEKGKLYWIDGTPRPLHQIEVTYIGQGVGAYKDEFGMEFTFSFKGGYGFYKDTTESSSYVRFLSQTEYSNQMNALKSQIRKEEDALMLTYVKGLRRFKIGQVLKSRFNNIIVVDKLLYARPHTVNNGTSYPIPVYRGRVLTQRLKPRKDGSTMSMYDTKHEQLEVIGELYAGD